MDLPNLDMDVLRTLAVAMDLGGFAKAADRLGRSQSAVSLQMRRLEERVGRALFRRQGRGLSLTDSGEVILDYARRILALNDQALTAARGLAIDGTVRFGVPQDFGDAWLPTILARFTRAYPSVVIEAHVERTSRLLQGMRQGELDLALIWGSPSLSNCTVVRRLPMRWIGRRDFVCGRGRDVPLAVFESPCVFRQPAIDALERAGRSWRIAFTSPSLAGLWAAAAAGLGVTVRTPVGVPPGLTLLGRSSALPKLPETSLSLFTAKESVAPAVARLREILLEELAAATASL